MRRANDDFKKQVDAYEVDINRLQVKMQNNNAELSNLDDTNTEYT